MRSAFLQVLSDDSIVFLPGPQNGKKAWESKPPYPAMTPDPRSHLNKWRYPPQEFSVTGREAAAATLARTPKPITFGEPKGEVSQGGDLGFAWGEYTAEEPGDYLRIWRKDRAGNWKLALELLHHR